MKNSVSCFVFLKESSFSPSLSREVPAVSKISLFHDASSIKNVFRTNLKLPVNSSKSHTQPVV